MGFPETATALAEAGYKFKNESQCRGCGAQIQWWKTPRGKSLPMDAPITKRDDAKLAPHLKTCPKAEGFRK
jgi:hypothetical protein